MRALVVLLAATGALGLTQGAFAQQAPAKKAPAPPAPAAVPASAIGHIATAIARALDQAPPGALVAASPLTSDVPAPRGEELAVRVATQIAGRLDAARVHPQPATLGAARGASGRAASLVYVQLEIAKGELRATADLYPVVSNAWERLRDPAPGPRAHAFASAPLDAEVRTFLQTIVLEQASVHKAKHEELEVLAIGCGDVDADGGNELVLATRTRIVIGKLRGGQLAVLRAKPWAELASRAPVPMREPIATVVTSRRRGELLVGVTDRGAVAVDSALVPRRQLTGLPIPGADGDACASASPELGAFEGSGVACAAPAEGAPAAVLPAPAARFDAVAALDLVGEDGSVSQVVAAREPTGKLRLRRRDARGASIEASIDDAGAEIALADLDLDGAPEIVFTADAAETDVLAVWTWGSSGFVPRLRFPAKDGVRAVATCPPEEGGLPALVAVVGDEIWLVR